MEDAGSNRALYERALRVIPGGVNSPVRAFRSVGGTPYFVARGEGAYVEDVEGNRYVDYVQSYGASILGHAHPVVVDAIRRAAGDGTSFGAPTEGEVIFAETVCSRVTGCEQVRLTSSGTEAAMSAVRLARGATGRTKIVKFDGCYHGHADLLLAGGGSGIATFGVPDSVGVTPAAVSDTVVVPYNVVPDLSSIGEARGGGAGAVACVIVEPVAANMGLVAPVDGFLEGLRRECDRVGALLVFDEVITGFRLGPSGASGAFGVTPDLWCFGKVIGGGLPVGAFGGRRDLMDQLSPVGPVYQAGTLSGNPVATAAGLAVLGELATLRESGYASLTSRAERLARGLADAFASAGVPAQVPTAGPLVGVFFGPDPVVDFAGARRAATRTSVGTGPGDGREGGATLYARFFHAMLKRGVALAPGAYEVAFPSFAHGEVEIDRTVEAAGESAIEIAGEP